MAKRKTNVPNKNKQAEAVPERSERSRLDERLDEALEETFPASDPVAIHIEEHHGDKSDPPGPKSR